ncbi:MAG: hypothetical protein A3B23_02330 [Candidatus Colwellbacteria bacterium RIFCSPLOWO2_01_FULL_48_10]|nr:MAG: hypothetical protein A3B23_02330 [Candidatus Colwellbacteria bacterium RIFCSPLOWO2_01_FULL_48_10]
MRLVLCIRDLRLQNTRLIVKVRLMVIPMTKPTKAETLARKAMNYCYASIILPMVGFLVFVIMLNHDNVPVLAFVVLITSFAFPIFGITMMQALARQYNSKGYGPPIVLCKI